jgi:hypothetical protein
MKSLILILTYFASFVLLYLLFSCVGLFFNHSYTSIIGDSGWFVIYSIFLGSWLSVFPTREYYVANEDYFDQCF